ncbi:MAG: NAD-dependent epimerase/dehydratase family protein [Ghiorsea sp.]
MQTVLLTGATGFLGSQLLEALLNAGYKVIVLKRSTSDTGRINQLLSLIKVYDVDCIPLENAFKEQRVDAVIHTACHYGRDIESTADLVESNVMFGLRVVDACIQHNVRTFVNTDTFFNNGEGKQKHLSGYILSKKQFVEWLYQKSNSLQIINLKLQHMFGPKDGGSKFIPWVISEMDQRKAEINLSPGDQLRDFIYIDDVVAAYLTVLNGQMKLPSFITLDVGTGKLTSLKQFLNTLKLIYGNIFGEVRGHLNFGAVPYLEGELMTVEVDNTELMNLGWSAKVSLEKGIENLLLRN